MPRSKPAVELVLEIFPGVSLVITQALALQMNIHIPRPHRWQYIRRVKGRK